MSSSGTKWNILKTILKWLSLGAVAILLVVAGIGVWLYQKHIVQEPGEHLSRAAILNSMEKESPIYYRDGETQINVLFQDRHRIYVEYSELPETWIQAITAAEDQRYFAHYGLDPVGIGRAVIQNLRARRIVSGASTLTQQTAKNLFNRPDRSFRSKAEEAFNALRLEAHYSKEEILEFYANQFHVTGNGRGIGIAARYYFDKEAADLTVLEAAFIAGMVKGPALYDPFFGTSEVRRLRNTERAKKRVQYVLGRMHEQGYVSNSEYEELLATEIPFRRGTFRYGKSSIVDEVVERLDHEPFPELFLEYNIDNPATAGLKIITTIDEDIQRQAQYGLVHHLSEVGGRLKGVSEDQYLFSKNKVNSDSIGRKYEAGDLFYGKVVEKKGAELVMNDGNGMCIVDQQALKRVSQTIAKGKNTPSSSFSSRDFINALSIGDVLWLSFRGDGRCDIEFDVALQGAVLALHKGEILAMVGGTENSDFNRATDAKRQFGSTWKPLIYAAALQLGWSPLDILDNRINAFPFERVWYYPRSGHKGAPDFISLSWAGVKSENRASVWLLYHLTDRLMIPDYRKVIEQVGLSRKGSESRTQYIERIRDTLGVISRSNMLDEIAFYAAKRVVLSDMEESDESVVLRSLLYGAGADKEINKLRSEELKQVVGFNYQALQQTLPSCVEERDAILSSRNASVQNDDVLFAQIDLFERKPVSVEEIQHLWIIEEEGGQRVGCGIQPSGARKMSVEQSEMLTKETPIWVDDVLSLSVLEALEAQRAIKVVLMADLDPYSVDFLMYHPDFQQLVNMGYVNLLVQSIGLDVTLPPTLTIPLGAVEISLLDVAMMYNGVITGKRFSLRQNQQKGNILVRKIIGPDGELLYEAEPEVKQVSNFISGLLVADILQNIVEHGTGRRARKYSTKNSTHVPLLGKTGTTNAYKNAAFVGIVPKAYGGAWDVQDGVVLATYVGFDEPESMVHKRTRLSGASGALPVWLQTVTGVEKSGYLGRPNPELTWEAPVQDGLFAVTVDTQLGLSLEASDEAEAALGHTWIYDPENLWGQEPKHARAFSPVNTSSTPRWEPLTVPAAEEEVEKVRIQPMEDDFTDDDGDIRPRIKRAAE